MVELVFRVMYDLEIIATQVYFSFVQGVKPTISYVIIKGVSPYILVEALLCTHSTSFFPSGCLWAV